MCSSKELLQKGVDLFKAKKQKEALQCFDRAIEIDPKDVRAWFGRGYMLNELGQYKQALEAYERVTELDSKNPEPWNRKGATLFDLGEYKRALETYERSIELDSKNPDSCYGKGNSLFRLGQYKQAIEAYERSIELDSKNPEPWHGKGSALFDLGQYKQALKAYERSIKLKPKYSYPWFGKGNSLFRLGQYKQALEAYERSIELDFKNSGSWHGKGNILFEFEQYKQALESYERSIELDSKNPQPWLGKGNSLLHLGQYKQALESYERAIELDSKNPEAWYRKGNALLYLGQYRQASGAYEISIELDSKNPETWYGKGNALLRLGQFRQALEAYERSIDLDPNLPAPWHGKGNFYIIKKDSKALGCFQRFIFLSANNNERFNMKPKLDLINLLNKDYTSPLLIERIFKQLINPENIFIYKNIWIKNQNALKDWKRIKEYRKENLKDTWNKVLFDSITMYYLGDGIGAFQLFDEVLDNGKNDSLRMQYYFGKTASSFFEQEEEIWSFAQQKALQYVNRHITQKNQQEAYYAALILSRQRKVNEARKILLNQTDHLPSLYALAELNKQDEEIFKANIEQILKIEKNNDNPHKLINGFKPSAWSIAEGKEEEHLQRFCYVQELVETITEVRDYAEEHSEFKEILTEFEHQPLHKALFVNERDENFIWQNVRLKKAKKLHEKLIEAFQENMKKDEPNIDTNRLDDILRKSEIMSEFDKLKEYSQKFDQEEFEARLSNSIVKNEYFNLLTTQYLLQYFYYTEKINARQALYLYFFLPIAIRYKKKKGVEVDIFNKKGAKEAIISLVNEFIPFGGLAYGFLSLLFNYVNNNLKTETELCDPEINKYTRREWEEGISHYYKYKYCFYQYLSKLYYSLGEEEFYKKYGVRGFEDLIE